MTRDRDLTALEAFKSRLRVIVAQGKPQLNASVAVKLFDFFSYSFVVQQVPGK